MGAAVISRLLFTTAKSSDNGTKAPSGNRVLMTFTKSLISLLERESGVASIWAV